MSMWHNEFLERSDSHIASANFQEFRTFTKNRLRVSYWIIIWHILASCSDHRPTVYALTLTVYPTAPKKWVTLFISKYWWTTKLKGRTKIISQQASRVENIGLYKPHGITTGIQLLWHLLQEKEEENSPPLTLEVIHRSLKLEDKNCNGCELVSVT